MLDPSSSEEEGDEVVEVERKEVAASKSLGGARRPPGRAADDHGGGGLQPRGRGSAGGRPSRPSPSVGSDKEKEDLEKMQREEEEKKKRLQLYVFVMRCIAYPFNAKQPTDMARRQQKISKLQLQTVKDRFQAFLGGDTQIVADEAFINAVQSYYEIFLKSDRVSRMVQSGGFSASDSREVFKKHIEKRVRSLPEIDGLSKETVLSSWIAKFDTIYRGEEDPRKHQQRMTASAASELILSKDQLYEMFQQILGIKKFEHQLLYNACQLDNPDEQAAQIRRELDGRLQMADQIARLGGRFPRLISREMEAMFIEELRSSVNLLMANLESMPVSKGGEFKLQKLKRGHNTSIMDMGQEDENLLSKSDVVLSFTLEVKHLQQKTVTFRLGKMKTKTTKLYKPTWCVRVSGWWWWWWEGTEGGWQSTLDFQYTFAMCSYREKKAEPVELLQLDGYTVDYTDPQPGETSQGQPTARRGAAVITAIIIIIIIKHVQHSGSSCGPLPPAACVQQLERVPLMQRICPMRSQSHYADRAQKHGMDEFISANPCNFDHASLFELVQRLTLDHRLNDSYSCLGWFSPGQVFVLDEYCARYGVRGCHRHLCYLSDLLERAENGAMIDPTLLHYSYAFCASHVHGNRPDGIGTVTVEEKERFEEIKERLRVLLENQITHFRYCFPFGRPEGALKATLSLLERVLMKDVVTPVPQEDVKAVIRKCLEQAAIVNYQRLSEYAKLEENVGRLVTPAKKLEDTIRLSELVIEVLQQNEEHHAEAFAWWSDLMVEHAETFLCLYSADMDAALEIQPPDSWDSFPLFQLLNDFLRVDYNLCNGKFHKHLQDLYAPLVVRYVDLMESSIAQSIHRGFERECWEPVNIASTLLSVSIQMPRLPNVTGPSVSLPQIPNFSPPSWITANCDSDNGSATSEDLFWKLDALQTFIRDLHWPEEEFGKHLETRLKLMSSDMIESCIKRTRAAFEAKLQRSSRTTDFRVPQSICTMFNVMVDAKSQSAKLCVVDLGQERQYHSQINHLIEETVKEMITLLVAKFVVILESVLSKLSRYDEGTLFSSFLSFTKPGMDVADCYVTFVRHSQDMLREKVNEEIYVERLFDQWYTSSMNLIGTWLTDRMDLQLHVYQLKILIRIVKKKYRDFRLQGVLDSTLNCKMYETVRNRLTLEEATASVREGGMQGITMRDSDEDDNDN
uniref:MHD1 domain-containing protein n=1 Tax=Xiphophorus couchianus TaxID=32473 RepID=A0A3B5L617_9TELE